jgi:hypothetical protein
MQRGLGKGGAFAPLGYEVRWDRTLRGLRFSGLHAMERG